MKMGRFPSAMCVFILKVSTSLAFTTTTTTSTINYATSCRTKTSSNVVLHMNLFDRFSRVAKSNLNNLANKLEDPEKIMDQALEEMQNDLVKVRQSYAEVTATQRRLMKQKEQCDAMA